MRVLLLTFIGVFAMSCFVFGGGVPSSSSPKRDVPQPIVSEAQDPVQEWDPASQGIGDLTEGPRTEVAPKDRKPIKIVGRLFRPEDFAAFVKKIVVPEFKKHDQWKPEFIVLHHTGIPS